MELIIKLLKDKVSGNKKLIEKLTAPNSCKCQNKDIKQLEKFNTSAEDVIVLLTSIDELRETGEGKKMFSETVVAMAELTKQFSEEGYPSQLVGVALDSGGRFIQATKELLRIKQAREKNQKRT